MGTSSMYFYLANQNKMSIIIIIFFIILFILTLYILLYLHFQYKFTYWKRNGVPYLKPSLIYGFAKGMITQQTSVADVGINIYKAVKRQTNKFGGIYMLSHQVIFPVDPEIIKSILTKDFHVFHDRGLYCDENIDPLSGTLVNLSGKKWKKMHAKFTPLFTPGKMKMMFQTLLNCNKELGNILEEYTTRNEPMDIYDFMVRLTTDYTGSCAFGIDCNSLRDPNAEFRKYGKLIIDTTFNETTWQFIGSIVPNLMKIFRIPMTNRKVSKFFLESMKQTVDYRKKNDIQRKDFVDLFLKQKNNESEEEEGKKNSESLIFNEMAAQAYSIFVGGFESTGSSLAYCLYEISVNQDIQDKLREEIVNVMEDNNEITYDAVMAMTFMDKVVSETLRKYPPVPLTVRVACKDYQIPGTNMTLKKNSSCWISIIGLHRDPEHYPDPENFDPDRFSEVENAKRKPFTYIPFGEGPRICIGMKFGLLQIKIALTSLLKNYKFTLNSKTILPIEFKKGGLMTIPENPIWLNSIKLTE